MTIELNSTPTDPLDNVQETKEKTLYTKIGCMSVQPW